MSFITCVLIRFPICQPVMIDSDPATYIAVQYLKVTSDYLRLFETIWDYNSNK